MALELWQSSEFTKGDERRRAGLLDVTGRIKGAAGYLLNLLAIGALLELSRDNARAVIFTQWAMGGGVALGDADLLTLLYLAITIVLLLQLVFTWFFRSLITPGISTFSGLPSGRPGSRPHDTAAARLVPDTTV